MFDYCKRKLRKLLGNEAGWTSVYYQESLDMLIVRIKNCSYTLKEDPPFLGGVMYENHVSRENVVGFQLYGIKSSLRHGAILRLSQEKGALKTERTEERWKISELVRRIADETEGGLGQIYGAAAEHVEKIMHKYPDLTVRIPSVYL